MPLSHAPLLAIIDEAQCIGCTLCIRACPFDAIIGASQQSHAVMSQLCTGCKLCIEPCPVDCIQMQENRELPGLTPEPPEYGKHQPCIKCDQCAPACPSGLMPDNLYEALKANKPHLAKSLEQCALCGECDKVCPSHIPLKQTFIYGKQLLAIKKEQKVFLRAGKARAQQREIRIARREKLKANLLARNKQSVAEKLQALKNTRK